MYTVSQKHTALFLGLSFANVGQFSNFFFTVRPGSKFAERSLLYFSSHLKLVATLHCETQKIEKNLTHLTQ